MKLKMHTGRKARLGAVCAALLFCMPALSQTPAPGPALRVPVQQFIVTGNTLLAPALLEQALQPFKGERSLAELTQAAQAVQDLYRQAGYGGVVAYLPEQSGGSGSATIAVLEGRVSRVGVTGNAAFDEANIRRSLPVLEVGKTPQVRELDLQIQHANENPAKQLGVSLEAGAKQGEIEVMVQVTERPPSRWTFGLDNTGNASTGRLRANVGYQHAALWDLDHQLSLQYQFAPEEPSAVTVLSASYRVPLYGVGLTLDLFGAYSDVDGGSIGTAAGALQFSGRGRVLGLRLGKLLPRLGEIEQRLSFGLDQRAYLNNCSIAGLPPGACGSAGESVKVQPLSIDYGVQRGGKLPISLSLGLSHNLALGGSHSSAAAFDAVRAGADRRYTALRAGVTAAVPLNDWQLQTRLNGQWSGDALVAGEQFGIAGAHSVRAYEEREITGDRGISGSLELLGPDLARAVSERLDGLRLLGFVDAGKVWNRLDTPCRGLQSQCGLASVGLGLRLRAAGLQLSLDVGHALRAAGRTERGDVRAHLSASYLLQ